jgi:hypothetical protein
MPGLATATSDLSRILYAHHYALDAIYMKLFYAIDDLAYKSLVKVLSTLHFSSLRCSLFSLGALRASSASGYHTLANSSAARVSQSIHFPA